MAMSINVVATLFMLVSVVAVVILGQSYRVQIAHDCEAAITKIASTQPMISMIVNGNVLPAEKAQAGYVGIVASCN